MFKSLETLQLLVLLLNYSQVHPFSFQQEFFVLSYVTFGYSQAISGGDVFVQESLLMKMDETQAGLDSNVY